MVSVWLDSSDPYLYAIFYHAGANKVELVVKAVCVCVRVLASFFTDAANGALHVW